MRSSSSSFRCVAVAVLALLVVVQLQDEALAACAGSIELSLCDDYFNGGDGQQASPKCCAFLNDVQPCLCDAMKQDPRLSSTITSAKGRRLFAVCHVDFPACS